MNHFWFHSLIDFYFAFYLTASPFTMKHNRPSRSLPLLRSTHKFLLRKVRSVGCILLFRVRCVRKGASSRLFMVKEGKGEGYRTGEGEGRGGRTPSSLGTWRSRISIIAGIKAGASFLRPPRSAFFPFRSPSTPSPFLTFSLSIYLPRPSLLKVLFFGTHNRD